MPRPVTSPKPPGLKRQVLSPYRGKSNQWWYKLTAFSFIVKVVLVLGMIFTLKLAADMGRAQEEQERTAEETAVPATDSAEAGETTP